MYEPWWEYARAHYLDLDGASPPETTTFYYDPTLDLHHRLPVRAASLISFYGASQHPGDARRLFEAACTSYGLDVDPPLPLPASRAFPSALLLAKEWGMSELEERLVAAIDASYEPTWDRGSGEFTWGLGLNEPHPRGQLNAFLAAAEAAGPGAWSRLSAVPLPPCPQVVGVDFPDMAFDRAEWIDGNLHLGLAPREEDPERFTTFRVVGAEPRMWEVHGVENARTEVTMSGLTVRVPMVSAEMALIRSSY